MAPPPGKINYLGRTKKRVWQDRNGSLAGQKLEVAEDDEQLSTLKLKVFLPFLSVFCHFWLVSAIFFCFSPIFCLFFCHLFSSLSISRTVWQDSFAEKLCTAAWQNTWPPLAGKNFGRKGLNFGRMKLLAPPKK